jgi:uncharacterized membrane protein required for colicin V production
MIIDIIIVAVILLFTLLGVWRGIARTLLNLVGMIVNMLLSRWLSNGLALWIYAAFIKPSVTASLEEQIMKNGFSEAVAKSLEAVPQWLDSIISSVFAPLGIRYEDLQNGMFIGKDQASSIANAIEEPLSRIIIAVLSMILMVVLFLVIMLIIKMIIRAILRAVHATGLSGINHFFGGILGFAEGFAFVFLAINIFYVIMTSASPGFKLDPQTYGVIFQTLCIMG